jgi:hypothetical protein
MELNLLHSNSRYLKLPKFALDLRAWRSHTNTARHSLADRVCVTPEAVKLWERGIVFPRDPQCDQLAKITLLECFGSERASARADSKNSLSFITQQKRRRVQYMQHASDRRRRSLESQRRTREARRQLVTREELEILRKDPRKRKNVCRECGQQNLLDNAGHVWQKHGIPRSVYKEKWGFLRGGNSSRSDSTQQKQSTAMKSHRPPNWTHKFLEKALKASIRTNKSGPARPEKLLNSRGRKLGARPQFWKRTVNGDLLTDARIGRLHLSRLLKNRAEPAISSLV